MGEYMTDKENKAILLFNSLNFSVKSNGNKRILRLVFLRLVQSILDWKKESSENDQKYRLELQMSRVQCE